MGECCWGCGWVVDGVGGGCNSNRHSSRRLGFEQGVRGLQVEDFVPEVSVNDLDVWVLPGGAPGAMYETVLLLKRHQSLSASAASVVDRTADGEPAKILTVTDEHTPAKRSPPGSPWPLLQQM